jgi:CP family cyanate transporter-like MFS transporter
MTTGLRHRETAHFIIIFLLVSFNLRMSFSAADPLLARLMQSLHLGVGSSSLLGLLPVMALGVAAPLGARLVEWVRPGILIIYALLFATAGVAWRSCGELSGLFGGTLIIGLGLGVAGTVILGIARQATPGHVPELMSAYTACVSLGTAVGAGVATPLEILLGSWQAGLLIWALPLLAATALWSLLVLHRRGTSTGQPAMRVPVLPLLRQRNARVISLYYLFRVASAWLLIVWLATLMKERGQTAEEAGWVLALVTVSQIPGAFLAGVLSRWFGGMHRLMSVATLLAVLACWGLLAAPLGLWPWAAVCLGLGLGCIFSIGMTLIAAAEPTAAGTIALSGLAQGCGFIGGGVLAWVAGMGLSLPHPPLAMAVIYSLLALTGLYFGLQCRLSREE